LITDPFCSVTSSAISSLRSSKRSASARRWAARSWGDVSRQSGSAARAAATPRETSSSLPSAMLPTVSSVEGSTTGSDSDALVGWNAPSTNISRRCRVRPPVARRFTTAPCCA
jgi:hypothetical protein